MFAPSPKLTISRTLPTTPSFTIATVSFAVSATSLIASTVPVAICVPLAPRFFTYPLSAEYLIGVPGKIALAAFERVLPVKASNVPKKPLPTVSTATEVPASTK